MNRVAIIGPSGAGKSTLARALGKRTGLPVYHLDAIHWKPGWVESEQEESRAKVEAVIETDQWIIDGNYSRTFKNRMARADTVIFLDLPRWRYFPRIFRRSLRYYGRTRPDMGRDCPERFDMEFTLWVWNFHRDSRHKILDALEQYAGSFVLHTLRSPKEVRQFLRVFQTNQPA